MAVEVPCPEITASDQSLRVRFPGGAEIAVQSPTFSPDGFQLGRQLLAQSSAALAPLTPVFNIIDAILAVFEVVEAIPDAIGLPPDPTAIARKIPDLARKVAKLASLVPQLSVPILAVDLIDVLITTLNGILTQLEALAAQEARIAAAALKAAQPGNASLLPVVECATDLATQTRAEISAGVAPLNRLLGVLRTLLELVPGAPDIPDLESLPESTEEAIDLLQGTVDLLSTLRDLIPVP